ncbi:FimV/HubP family polar landmark protein [Inhella sp.]|uniref:FimV/HubP family polar landmark protein n=1 Tax=Inhella sp. TaxID=1921806 RepID=UPI0035B31489
MAACLLATGSAQALGLGRLQVQSALGETLRAEIEVVSLSAEEESSLRVRVASPDAFRAQGLDYNAVMSGTQVQLVRQPSGRVVLRLVSDRAVQEPFLDVLLDMRWATGRLNREYTLLFDPPGSPAAAAPSPAPVAPVISAPAPVTATPRPAAPSPVAAPAAVQAATPVPAPAAPRPADGAVVVRRGDSLSRLAGSHRPSGVSLDQMLVALYRENPDAFIGGNMNLLRAGARLRMPSAEQISALGADEARRLVRAHSSNFDTVRQGLAAAAPSLPPLSDRVAKGVVQPKVTETRPPAPGGDRLTLSKPGGAASVPPPDASRLADAARDLEATRKLAEAAKQAVTPAAIAAPAIAQVASSAASGTEPAVAGGAPAASMTASAASAMAAPPASRAALASPPPAAAEPEQGWLDLVLSPLGAGIGALLVALGAAVIYRVGKKRKTGPAQETLFGESRLQPDSFFGVTGGQRVDTRDGATGASSMSYSLSQLDAHGDVDPVAEADVYLAYGRDLQAEEILKEALRAQPERLAIRLKLLEVYAKRRDVRGYEQLATQLYAETKGAGEDWDKAQEMGRSIDPDNSLYQPGGAPRSMFDEDAPRPEPMNATTLPQAVPVSLMPAEPEAPHDDGPPSLIDLDLDLGSLPPAPADAMSRTQTMPALPPLDAQPSSLDMDLDISEPMPLDGKKDNSLEFDLSDLGDLGGTTVSAQLGNDTTASMGLRTEAPADEDSPITKVGGDSLIDAMQDLGDDADPMMRQLELADEFRQIGDVEGARDVLQELLNQVDAGPLYEKAKAMLDELR